MTTPHGLQTQQKIAQALEVLAPRQVWEYKGNQHQLIVFNRREGIVKTWNLTQKKNDCFCVVWLVEKGSRVS